MRADRVSVYKGADAKRPALRHSPSMIKPSNTADAPMGAKPATGRAFAHPGSVLLVAHWH